MRTVPFAVLTLAASAASAQFHVTNLHPAGSTESYAYAIGPGPSGIREGGLAVIGGASHAAMWSGAAASFVDLHSAGATASAVYGVSGAQQCGVATVFGTTSATVWSGTAATAQIINPGQSSSANCISNGMVGGSFLVTGTSSSACHWIGTVRTTDSGGTTVLGVDNPNRVGSVRTGSFPLFGANAVMWSGSSTSATSLHPPGASNSGATAISGNQQVGRASFSTFGPNHAVLWTGTAASFVDLHPAPATSSECAAVNSGVQVGFAMLIDPNDPNMNSVSRAAMWTGTAASWVNLHTFLPANFGTSTATGVYRNGGVTYIVGYGFNNTTARNEALLWTSLPPCGTADFNCDGDVGTDADIAAFFACLAGNCPSAPCTGNADFNGDGDVGTDADIAAFFRVLAGGNC